MDALEQLGNATQKAEAARRLLEAPVFKEAVESLEQTYLARFRGSQPQAAHEREDAYYMLRALDELTKHLGATVQGGKVAAFNLRSKLRDR